MIQYLHTSQSDSHKNPNYHLSPKLLQYYWLYCLCCALHPITYLIYNWKLIVLLCFLGREQRTFIFSLRIASIVKWGEFTSILFQTISLWLFSSLQQFTHQWESLISVSFTVMFMRIVTACFFSQRWPIASLDIWQAAVFST